MADYDSSLPVRTENDGDVVGKLAGLTTANIAEVNAANEQLVKDADALAKLTDIETTINMSRSVTATDLDIRDLDYTQDNVEIKDAAGDALGINADGSINVNIVASAVSATEQHINGTTVAGVPNTPNDVATHTVTAAKTFILRQWAASGSGKFKAQLSVNAVIMDTQFNSTAQPNVERTFGSPIEVAAGQIIKVIVTNKDQANQDLYAFFCGNEV